MCNCKGNNTFHHILIPEEYEVVVDTCDCCGGTTGYSLRRKEVMPMKDKGAGCINITL